MGEGEGRRGGRRWGEVGEGGGSEGGGGWRGGGVQAPSARN